ncbi:adenylate/guanylate cyclase domain-containing protein [Methylobacterium sp. P31]
MGRRLAAILVADIVGYSRLMGKDEAGTIRRLKALRRDLIDPAIKAAQGRIVKTMGDGLLVEFPSPLRAVSCAVRIQRAMSDWETALPDDRRFKLRFGINVGDVIAQPDGDLFGDGVNVAARLEPLAEPGGLCVSRSVHEQVRDKLPYRFEDRGKLELKNIARPIGVFALTADAVQALALPDDEEDDAENAPGSNGAVTVPPPQIGSEAPRRFGIVGLASVIGVVALASVGVAAWSLWPGAAPKAENTLAVQNGLPPKPLPPLSLVVLPFANLSNDPEQDFFADGLTEDLTTDLSHLAGSFVIARNTAFTYKGKAVDVKQVGRDLGVRYALEGSVRRTGEHVVLNAQLISTETGAHIWADRFEGARSRLGELQTEFVARLARSLDVQLTEAESLRSLRERQADPDAADLALRGWAILNKPRSLANNNEAAGLFKKALDLDPSSPRALIGLARTYIIRPGMSWSTDKAQDIKEADSLVTRFQAAYPNDALGYVTKGDVLRASKQFEAALSMYEAAIANDRNYAMAYALKGHISTLTGNAPAAIPSELEAIRLSPKDPLLNVWYYFVCHSYTHQRRWEEAIPWCNKSVAAGPYWLSYVDLAAGYAWMGKSSEAQAAVSEVLKLMPGYTVQKWAHEGWSDNKTFLAEYEYITKGLRMAGMPEGPTN